MPLSGQWGAQCGISPVLLACSPSTSKYRLAWKRLSGCGRTAALAQELRLGDDAITPLPAVDFLPPLSTLQVSFQVAAHYHATVARLSTLRTLELWPDRLEDPPSEADTAALLAALAALPGPGVGVLWRERPWNEPRPVPFPPSDPRLLVELHQAFADAMK